MANQIKVFLRKDDSEAHVGKFAVTDDVFQRLQPPLHIGREPKQLEDEDEKDERQRPTKQRKTQVRMFAPLWKPEEDEERSLLLADSASTVFRGSKEKGQLSGWVFFIPTERGLDAIPAGDWFSFKPVSNSEEPHLTLEEAMRLQRRKDRARDKRTLFLVEAGYDGGEEKALKAERDFKKEKKAKRKERREAENDFSDQASDDEGQGLYDDEESSSEEESSGSEDEDLREETRRMLADGGQLVKDTIEHGGSGPGLATASAETIQSSATKRKRKREGEEGSDRPRKKSRKKQRPTTKEEVIKVLKRGPISPSVLIKKFKQDREVLFQIVKQVAEKGEIDGQTMIVLKKELQ